MTRPDPYREPAEVEPMERLVPLHPFCSVFSCPKCGVLNIKRGKFCTGFQRRAGFFNRVVEECLEKREHFHLRCYECDWEGLMAPKDAS